MSSKPEVFGPRVRLPRTAMSPMPAPTLDEFRSAMSSFASGVTIVTTVDADGGFHGFTASSFCSVSASPPLVLVCLDHRAECSPVFMKAECMAVNILSVGHADLAARFASKGPDKFAGQPFDLGALGVPVLAGAASVVECEVDRRIPAGDHLIIVGLVRCIRVAEASPLIFHQRGFHTLTRPSPESTSRALDSAEGG